jgi:hypothetical protein
MLAPLLFWTDDLLIACHCPSVHLFCRFQLPRIRVHNTKVVDCIEDERVIRTESFLLACQCSQEPRLYLLELPLIFLKISKVVDYIRNRRVIWSYVSTPTLHKHSNNIMRQLTAE